LNELVIDASVALAWCFPDESAADPIRVLDELKFRKGIVPGHWSIEISNAILAGERRHRLTAADVSRFLTLLHELSFTVDPFTSQRATGHILPLARATGLSAYDAAYLDLAMREGLELVTLDSKLSKAAKASGGVVFLGK